MNSFRLGTFGAGLVLLSAALAAQPPAPALIRDVAAGQGVLVVKGDGTVVTFGGSASGNVPVPTVMDLPGKVLKVAVGGANFGTFTGYALLEDGTVVSWGSNADAQLGNGASGVDVPLGTYPKPSTTPVKVTGLT